MVVLSPLFRFREDQGSDGASCVLVVRSPTAIGRIIESVTLKEHVFEQY